MSGNRRGRRRLALYDPINIGKSRRNFITTQYKDIGVVTCILPFNISPAACARRVRPRLSGVHMLLSNWSRTMNAPLGPS
ncbi:hypothetical protein EVAR_46231_1 [Eumeta japonica]|uniref:Uncharacterized protein n=1 Tax=Eumeta variegata TaxID=151549 RepID=A0A4C1XQE8_EUMVA|nr:hypothetical protein EVAR_46231_1 [Eumeta japonica]